MKYQFPHIRNLDEVLPAIEDRQEFVVAERDDYTVVNYLVNMEDTFPKVETVNDTIRRECRGLVFDKNGKILARRFHKFHNVGERDETQVHNLDMNVKHIILEKLDGSMITPIILGDEVCWGTKMGLTEIAGPVADFTNRGIRRVDNIKVQVWYNDFAYDLYKSGMTPIFEWCSRKQRIVIDYPEDDLILTAIRRTVEGNYLRYDQMVALAEPYKVPVVKSFDTDIDDMNAFIESTRGLIDLEGYVVRFVDGHMLKIKADHYLSLHRAMDQMRFEKDIVEIIVNDKADDFKAYLDERDFDNFAAFENDFWTNVNELADKLNWIVIEAKDNLNDSKKRFAMEYVNQADPLHKGLLYKIWDGKDPLAVVKNQIANNTGSSTKIDAVRGLFGSIKWEDYK